MESGIQSSFIPKDAGKVTVSPRQPRGGGLSDLIFLISIVLFVASCALAGGVFLYKQYLESSAASKVAQLERARDAFEPALIQQLTRLDDRMRAADNVLSAHLAPTAFFFALSEATLTTVSFRSLDLNAVDPKKISIKMQGVARSVNSVALQADLLSKNGVVTSPIFSNISRQADGVHFDLSALVNPAAVNFVSLLNAANRASQTQPQAQQPSQQTLFGEPSQGASQQSPQTPPATTPPASGGTTQQPTTQQPPTPTAPPADD